LNVEFILASWATVKSILWMEFSDVIVSHLVNPLDIPLSALTIAIGSDNNVIFVLSSNDLSSFIDEFVSTISE
jgi:hypothetical protein